MKNRVFPSKLWSVTMIVTSCHLNLFLNLHQAEVWTPLFKWAFKPIYACLSLRWVTFLKITFHPGVDVFISLRMVNTLEFLMVKSGPETVVFSVSTSLLLTSGSTTSIGIVTISPTLMLYSRAIPLPPRIEHSIVLKSSWSVLNLVGLNLIFLCLTTSSVSSPSSVHKV